MSEGTSARRSALVTGDIVLDHHVYEGERLAATQHGRRGVSHVRELGGAAMTHALLAELLRAEEDPSWDVRLGIAPPAVTEDGGQHAYAVWKLVARTNASHDRNKPLVWRTDLPLGYSNPTAFAPAPTPGLDAPRLLVLDDAGGDFRRRPLQPCWLLPADETAAPDWIVLKTCAPLGHGDLWHALVPRFQDRLVCVVRADDVRGECVGVSRGLSWERSVEDLRAALSAGSALAALGRCRHLIVRFGAEGALWIERTAEGSRAQLVFDGASAEGDWDTRRPGSVFGTSSVFTSAIASALARHSIASTTGEDRAASVDLLPAIESGLHGVRDLLDLGHGGADGPAPRGFPAGRVAAAVLAAGKQATLASFPIPWPGEPRRSNRPWMIVEAAQRPPGGTGTGSLVGVARQVVVRGSGVLQSFPHAHFGKLVSIDRAEIETLRSLHRLMEEYAVRSRADKPLSIGVFGPPGAGKSFGVKQIANEVFRDKLAWLEFNLSQFRNPSDLNGAFHQVRDKVLSGATPVVFWDEFDSQSYDWLRYLLAPMQDGRFQEGQLSHWIGKCVFVFAGGTSPTFAEFAPPGPTDSDAWRNFRLCKGPDFQSRLDAYYDVAGPNQRRLPRDPAAPGVPPAPDPDDACYPLRRALLIRAILTQGDKRRLDFDPELLDALLLVPEYRHGARSLEKLVAPLAGTAGKPVRRSALPAPAQLAMHVDADAFTALLTRNDAFRASPAIDRLAASIHGFWRGLPRQGQGRQPHFDQAFADLAPIDKEDNRAAAQRIPAVLALAGLALAEEGQSEEGPSEQELVVYLQHHLELLAEGEHDGWMDQRLRNGWRPGPRASGDPDLRHNLLIPYADLSEDEKEKDRNTVRHYPEMVTGAAFRVAWLGGPRSC